MSGKRKKLLSSTTALVCVVALLIGGTFAWRGVSSALNEFGGTKEVVTDPGANLHVDSDNSTGEKNVYVENTGDADVFVRIQLSEIFVPDGTGRPDPMNWVLFEPTALTDSGTYFDAYGSAFSWTLGNTAPYNYKSIVDSTEWAAAADRSETDELVGDAFGSSKPGSAIVMLRDATTESKVAPAGTVITMADYTAKNATDKADFEGWVYDVDGYAYWSQPLAEDATTSMLMSAVELPTPGSETFYYAINVDMEYVDIKDLPAWTEGVDIQAGANAGEKAGATSTDAQAMLKALVAEGEEPTLDVEIGDTFMASGYEWVVLEKDDAGNAFVTTKYLIGPRPTVVKFNNEQAGLGSNVYAGSNLEAEMDALYARVVTSDETETGLKITEMAQPSNAQTVVSTDHTPGNPGLSVVTESGKTSFFPLNAPELAKYFANNSARIARYEDNTAAWYWLRGPGQNDNTASSVNMSGATQTAMGGAAVTYEYALRPALWIKL